MTEPAHPWDFLPPTPADDGVDLDFEDLLAVYPRGAIGEVSNARIVWDALLKRDRKAALEALPRVLRGRKDEGKDVLSLSTYLSNRDWVRFPQPPKAAAVDEPSIELKPFVRELYALFWRAVAASRTRDVEYFLGRIDKGLVTPVSAVFPLEEVQALLPVTIGSEAHARWVTWGERMGIRLPKPDQVPVIMVPEFEPPALSMRWKGYRLGIAKRLGVRSKEWWWRLFQDGSPIGELLSEGRKSEGTVPVEFGPWPATSDLVDMVEIKRGTEQWEAWEMWFWKVRGDLRLWHENSIWCPSEYPTLIFGKDKQDAGAAV